MPNGANNLARAIREQILNQTIKPDALELGLIQPDMSLKLDRFAVSVPQGEYLIVEWMAKIVLPTFSLVGVGESPVEDDGTPDPPTEWTQQTRWDFNPGEIDEVKIEVKPDLSPGDRVLVAWVNNGTDPIVVSKVVSS